MLSICIYMYISLLPRRGVVCILHVRTYIQYMGGAEVAFFSMYSTNFKYTGAPGFINNNN